MDAVQSVVVNPKYKLILSLVKAVRNGLMYGVKIRFPHSLVMTFLFQEGTLREKIAFILSATLQHARNLALFSLIYKSLCLLLKRWNGCGHPLHNFVSAMAGGYFVFGSNNKINMQINLYLLSRVSVGLARLSVKKGLIKEPSFDVFPLFGAVVWGLALVLYEYHKDTLQPSLQSSMTYLYHESTVWTSIWDLLLYNSQQLW